MCLLSEFSIQVLYEKVIQSNQAKISAPTLLNSSFFRTDHALRLALATCLSLLPRISFITVHAESLTLKNITRENVNGLEKSQIACATSDRPVNHSVNHIIPRVGNYKYFSCSGLVYTTPEKFENGGFIKCFPSTLPRRNLKSNEHSSVILDFCV